MFKFINQKYHLIIYVIMFEFYFMFKNLEIQF